MNSQLINKQNAMVGSILKSLWKNTIKKYLGNNLSFYLLGMLVVNFFYNSFKIENARKNPDIQKNISTDHSLIIKIKKKKIKTCSLKESRNIIFFYYHFYFNI